MLQINPQLIEKRWKVEEVPKHQLDLIGLDKAYLKSVYQEV